MPVIHIDNFPPSMWENGDVKRLAIALRQACLEARIPGIERLEQITPVAGGVRLIDGGGLIIVVEELFRRPERTLEVRRHLAEALADATRKIRPHTEVVVRITPWNVAEDPYLVVTDNRREFLS